MLDNLMELVWIIIKILSITLPLLLCVAYLTLAERRIIGFLQDRLGPNRVGPMGLLQPIADAIKLVFKEMIFPTNASKILYFIAPVISFATALIAWAVIPFSPHIVLANVNAGLLFLLAMTSMGVYGVIIAGWASNSKYAFLGAIRCSAQIVSYEIAMGFCLVGVVLASGSLNIGAIVEAQKGGVTHWYWLPLLPLFVVYWISAVAETNRSPFDVAEGESEIVAGFHVEYGSMAFALFFLAEYANMILLSTLCSLMFMGGWLSPFEGIPMLAAATNFIPPMAWLFAKAAFFLFLYLWFRATFPRYRYDQIMRLGWKILIPVTFVWLIVVAFAKYYHLAPWFA